MLFRFMMSMEREWTFQYRKKIINYNLFCMSTTGWRNELCHPLSVYRFSAEVNIQYFYNASAETLNLVLHFYGALLFPPLLFRCNLYTVRPRQSGPHWFGLRSIPLPLSPQLVQTSEAALYDQNHLSEAQSTHGHKSSSVFANQHTLIPTGRGQSQHSPSTTRWPVLEGGWAGRTGLVWSSSVRRSVQGLYLLTYCEKFFMLSRDLP